MTTSIIRLRLLAAGALAALVAAAPANALPPLKRHHPAHHVVRGRTSPEATVNQAVGNIPPGVLPEKGPAGKDKDKDTSASEPKQAACTSANASSPNCYTATQQGKPLAK